MQIQKYVLELLNGKWFFYGAFFTLLEHSKFRKAGEDAIPALRCIKSSCGLDLRRM